MGDLTGTRMSRRKMLQLLAGAAGGSLLVACSSNAPSSLVGSPVPATEGSAAKPNQSGPYGTLVGAVSSFGEDRLDPIYSSSAAIIAPIFDILVMVDNNGNVRPNLISSYSFNTDASVWTLKARPGLKFHNGDEMTAADIKFSIERMIGPKSRSPWSPGYRSSIDKVEAPDASTVVVTLKKPEATFIYQFAGLYVLNKKYTEEKGDDYAADNPVGLGPWKFISHQAGQSAEYEAVPNHHRVVPAFQKLTLKLVPEESTRMAMMKRGEVDVTDISIDKIDEAKAAGLDIRIDPIVRTPLIAIKGSWLDSGQPLHDQSIRQALSLSINRDELCQTIFKGYATPGGRLFTGSYSWGWDPAWTPDPYDPKKAKELLAAAGYPDKFKDPVITVWSFTQPGASWVQSLQQAISGYFEAIGVKSKIVSMDYATLYAKYFYRPPDPIVVDTAYTYVTTGMANSLYYVHSAYLTTSFWDVLNDPNWDALWSKMLAEIDENKRVDLFRQAMVIAHDRYVDINTVMVKNVYASSKQCGEWVDPLSGANSFYEKVQHKA